MHRSRVGVVLLDHPADGYDAAASFWAAATGSPRTGDGPPADHPYETLASPGGGVELALQRTGVGTPARVHLDIETDDVRAEIDRVVALGATVLDDRGEYAILADPGGVPFCVVPVQTGAAFTEHATSWP